MDWCSDVFWHGQENALKTNRSRLEKPFGTETDLPTIIEMQAVLVRHTNQCEEQCDGWEPGTRILQEKESLKK
jgi:hypothetical protein